jgi:general stress protein 26
MQTRPADLNQAEFHKIHDFLVAHPIGVVATVDETNNPHASTVYYSVDEQLQLYFTTKRDTVKHRNLQHNPRLMLAVYEGSNQSAVQLSGTASVIDDPETVQAIFQSTIQAAEHTGKDVVPPIAKIFAGPYVAYQVTVDNVWMQEYGWGDNFGKVLRQAGRDHNDGDPA